jgi:hypothetical protein
MTRSWTPQGSISELVPLPEEFAFDGLSTTRTIQLLKISAQRGAPCACRADEDPKFHGNKGQERSVWDGRFEAGNPLWDCNLRL